MANASFKSMVFPEHVASPGFDELGLFGLGRADRELVTALVVQVAPNSVVQVGLIADHFVALGFAMAAYLDARVDRLAEDLESG